MMAGMLCYYNYHVCDRRVKIAGRVHTHMGDANRHIEMMLPNIHDNNIETCPQF
jgi:hypothetical protein